LQLFTRTAYSEPQQNPFSIVMMFVMIRDKAEARKIMKQLYKDVWAYTIPRRDDLRIRKASGSSLYGEITFGALDKLIRYLDLDDQDVFYDLGSGVGKVVHQIAMTTNVKRVVGVELSATRFKDAQKVRDAAAKEKWISKARCKFEHGDILKADLSKATVLYTCSTAFPMTFMMKLAKKLAESKRPQRIISLQELPQVPGLKLIDKIPLDMSWVRQTPVYVFETQP